jgi:uncharacterized protein YutE (UPF0331/DUF86 family)/predicted nucleotidyltransferase
LQCIEDLIVRIKRVLETDNEILLAYLFGSQGEGRATEHSDVDIAILHCGCPSVKVGEIQKKVVQELRLNGDKVDVVDISKASAHLIINIVKGLRLIDRGDFERRLIKELIKSPGIRVMKDSSLMFDSSVIDFMYSRLEKIKEEVAYLNEEILMKGAEVVATDGTLRRAMARSAHETIEVMLDICRNLVSVKALGAAEGYHDFPRLLRQHNIMPLSLAETLEKTATLRITLVQGCAEVDHHKLFDKAHEIVEHIAPEFEEWVLGLLR